MYCLLEISVDINIKIVLIWKKYDVHRIIILKGAVNLHHIDVEMSKIFANCGGDTPASPLLGHYLPV